MNLSVFDRSGPQPRPSESKSFRRIARILRDLLEHHEIMCMLAGDEQLGAVDLVEKPDVIGIRP